MEELIRSHGLYGFPVFFVGVWLGVSSLIAWIGGWRELAAVYPADDVAEGTAFRFQSARLRASTRYGGALNLHAGYRGLRLSIVLLFRFAHPPVFIPWEDIRVERKDGRWIRSATLHFARCPRITLEITTSLAEQSFSTAGRPIPEAPEYRIPGT